MEREAHNGREDKECDVDRRMRRDAGDGTVDKLVDPEAHGAEEEKDGEVQAGGGTHEELRMRVS